MYKYRCRGCAVQGRCIEQSDTSVGVKEMLRNAFAARTDTTSTWAVLQKHCLLVLEDEERERQAEEGALSGQRLRAARAGEEEAGAGPEEAGQAASEGPDVVELAAYPIEEFDQSAAIKAMISDPDQTGPMDFETKATRELVNKPVGPETLVQPEEQAQPEGQPPAAQTLGTQILGTQILDSEQLERAPAVAGEVHWLVVANSQRRIALPTEGEVILGRFDPGLDEPLDVDLTFEDQETLGVSRRHARISVQNGRHMLEDLGSSNGTTVNNAALAAGQAYPLSLGDRIGLGDLKLVYQPAPPEFYPGLAAKAAEARHLLFITHVGVKLDISPPDEIIIGRTDPDMQIFPTLDLASHGDLAVMVSRRHAALTWRGHQPHIQDLKSSFGTRLNGRRLAPHQATALKPGDQISLGNCVLAYDVEI